MKPDLIICNARVVTMDGNSSEVEAFSVKDGRVMEVGSSSTIKSSKGPGTEELDAQGKMIVPGFIDAHAHLELLAYSWEIAVDYRTPPVESIEDIVERLGRRVRETPAGEWILGQGNHYQDAHLRERRYPDRHDLDRVSGDHPIVARFSFHVNIFNSKALEVLGVDRSTPDAPGGRLERDPATGEPTGRTFDMYHALGVPDWPFPAVLDAVRTLQGRYLAAGVTGIGDIPLQGHGLPVLREMYRRGDLRLRVTTYPKAPSVVSFRDALDGTLAQTFSEIDPAWLRLGGIKLFLDGGLTSAAAALHEPYATIPGYRGEMAFQPEELQMWLRELDRAGHQILIHAIGDRALDTALEAFSSLPQRRDANRGPHRIEHGGNLFMDSKRIECFKRSGVLPVPQPAFIHTTASGYREYLGRERSQNLMPFRTLLSEGFPLPGNSDAIGIDARQHEPMFGIWCLVCRRAGSGEILDGHEAIGVSEAMRMYTRYAAMSIGMGRELGSIEPGKLADFLLFERDLRTVESEDLLNVRVDQTWVGGKCVYDRAVGTAAA
ncbi:MAG: amidohydrolase [bacterium]|nr:amidohydrolase [bacterium]